MGDEELTPAQRRAKEQFVEYRGYWPHRESGTPHLHHILELDPEYLVKYGAFSSYPDDALDPKVRQFLRIAMDVVSTRQYISLEDPDSGLASLGASNHIRFAFEYGATLEELVEVVELAVSAGIYSTLIEGSRLLAEETSGGDSDDEATDRGAGAVETPSETHEERREKYAAIFGSWSDLWDDLLEMDPEYFDRTTDLFGHPWEDGSLDPKHKELVSIACSINSTHLYREGTRMHIRGALEHGATKDEILATIQIASTVGMHAAIETMPVLAAEARERGLLD